ncbi:MAG TPA: glycoside hydrolase family 57 protein [Vicinamibacterales bacterium]|nr:glycoside hydrolase family 57 protein [Vicinamibacterales bacterium]
MTRVALLWHMHQPYYEDLVTREHILPWVRLHALKDYYGMVALLREFPSVRMTFNLVPSMLVQLKAFAAGEARDRFLELSLKAASDLTADEAAFVVANFFHAQRERMINVYPRYAELADLRGSAYTVDDLRDLQVWHKLAWIDPLYLDGDDRVRALVLKGREFSEDDKAVLRTVELEILNNVIPEYRAAAARGQIEISASPFYHPILPLLCDTDVYLATHPDSNMPRQRFAHPEDASEQLTRAAAYHARLFGRPPVGLWPSEGSVSDAMVPLVAEAGFRWMATDEQILARTLGVTFSRDGYGHAEQPLRLYAAYDVRAGGGSVACVFRDHVLSDLIGFTYASWNADAAADDFVGRLVEAGRRYRDRGGRGEPLVSVILDGENAWEHFEGGGRPFLRALYRRLSHHPELRTVTMSEGCAEATERLDGIFPGSWIDANFYIWIGHADDQRAWSQLADARQALDAAAGVPADILARAREEVLVAEGSDWFWWYGDDHSSAHDLEFDDLFRRHLRNAYGLLGLPVPDELFISNISTGAAPASQTAPTGLLAPTLDGEETSYFEWHEAGRFEAHRVAGAMHQTSERPAAVTRIHFGFDSRHLFVRVDAEAAMVDVLGDGREVSLKFVTPAGVRYSIRQTAGRLTGRWWDRHVAGTAAHWVERGPGAATVAAGSVLEISLPLADLRASVGDTLSFFVAVYDGDTESERHPQHRPIELTVPGAEFAAEHWRA